MGGFWQTDKTHAEFWGNPSCQEISCIRKLFGFLTVHLAHCQGAHLQCSLTYQLGFLKMQGWTTVVIWDLSVQLGDIMASRLPGTGWGTCKPRELLFPYSTDLSTVEIPEFLFEIYEHNDCHCKIHVDQAAADKSPQLHREGIFAVHWQNKQTNKQNTDIQNEVTSAKACSRGNVGLRSGSVIARMFCSVFATTMRPLCLR